MQAAGIFGFSLGGEKEVVFLHRREDTQSALHPSGVIVADIVLDHMDKRLLAGEPLAIIALTL